MNSTSLVGFSGDSQGEVVIDDGSAMKTCQYRTCPIVGPVVVVSGAQHSRWTSAPGSALTQLEKDQNEGKGLRSIDCEAQSPGTFGCGQLGG